MKPKVAFFDFAGCEGDQLQIANLEEEILDLLGQVEVVSFREVMKEHSDDYDIAFVEGSCTRIQDEERLKQIRKNASVVVAIGSCATIGGINSLKNYQNLDAVKKTVYGEKADLFDTYLARPIDAVISVDAYVHGCPMTKEEFLHVVKSLLLGKKPDIPNYPVCVECKKNENVCAFERGEFCIGPVTRAGCNSCCVNEGTKCWGCRGLVDNPNENSQKEVLIKYGLSVDEAISKFRLYFGWEKKQ
ncbi:MAG: NADH:ubiquinone oxidoreductase [Candidatus Bathyarchaeota archaeon]|jgi:coenzyme F420-reducing hydrogenase gamma subunit|nr:NADH:ubiquinone oxidoreductase [Candidatus Bathyarchaeota archaeon]